MCDMLYLLEIGAKSHPIHIVSFKEKRKKNGGYNYNALIMIGLLDQRLTLRLNNNNNMCTCLCVCSSIN